jgi:hypothetical protein
LSPALRPACACDRAGTSRGGAPRCSYEATPATPHRETPARFPHAPASWLLPPTGLISPPPSRSRWAPLRGVISVFGRGEKFRLVGGAAMAPEATGSPACGSGVGCRGHGCLRTPRGPAPGRTAGSWPEESRRAVSGGEQATSGHLPARQNKSLTQLMKRMPIAGQEWTYDAVGVGRTRASATISPRVLTSMPSA